MTPPVHDMAEHTTTILWILQGLVALVNFLMVAILGYGWKRINRIEDRQEKLREETLPNDYVRKDGLVEIDKKIDILFEKLDHFMEDCRKGLCGKK